ncbi:Polyphosphate kinase [Entomobacter blattae]|uniref:Polyphosphate kinase n=2 Tax=Entomobacter blattae TaxID=2762277 RepID=A0A7H1NS01_9PROT|nr:Polyphosphate kinase [Entomobacter blattae]
MSSHPITSSEPLQDSEKPSTLAAHKGEDHMMACQPERFINRELSWLDFNHRVVEEADNTRNPLLERLRFLSISASNLDEFFSVRFAGLVGQVREGLIKPSSDGLTPAQQLTAVRERTRQLMNEQQRIWFKLCQELKNKGVEVCDTTALSEQDKNWLRDIFMNRLFPVLTPLAMDTAHPLPFIPNMGLAMVMQLKGEAERIGRGVLIVLPGQIERFIRLPFQPESPSVQRFVVLEEMIALFMDILFPGMKLAEWGVLRVIRDTDVEFEDEAEDLVRSYETALKLRRRGTVIHLDIDSRMPLALAHDIADSIGIAGDEVVIHKGLLGLTDLRHLITDSRPDLLFPTYTPQFPERIKEFGGDCFAAIRAGDLLVHHPFESFDVVVQFLRQAATDEAVIAIKQTLYRTSHNSPIVKALIEAAENGKSVTAMVELRARFDEEANIRLARALEAAGVQVVFGFADFKTHAKLSLVVRKEGGRVRSYTHFGTGNYHPITARIYTDLSFFTCNEALVRDAARLFNYMTGYARPEKMEAIAYSPVTIRPSLMALIDEEIAFAKAGRFGTIWLKMNSLVDSALIDKLYEASEAGVKISGIVRGMCCLRPGVPGLSENIRIKSVVGRFLEHARVFVFGNGRRLPSRQAKVYISSADWMERNMDWRVESMVPIYDTAIHAKILNQIMVANLKDTLQSWMLRADGHWEHVRIGQHPFSAHNYFMANPSLEKDYHRREKQRMLPATPLSGTKIT